MPAKNSIFCPCHLLMPNELVLGPKATATHLTGCSLLKAPSIDCLWLPMIVQSASLVLIPFGSTCAAGSPSLRAHQAGRSRIYIFLGAHKQIQQAVQGLDMHIVPSVYRVDSTARRAKTFYLII